MIISFILMTCTFDDVVMLQGEFKYWSLLGLIRYFHQPLLMSIPGLLTGCTGLRDRTIWSNPHNNAQFPKPRKIPHNTERFAEIIKSGLLLITKIPKNFLGYFQAIYLPKQSRNPSLSSIARADIKCKAFCHSAQPGH